MEEIWKWIPGYEGEYEASNLGQVKSYKFGKPHILKVQRRKDGYRSIGLGRNFTPLLHRVIAITFLPNPLDLPEVNHKDAVKTNNRADNLEWVTSSQNKRHAWGLGLMKVSPPRGEDAPHSHLTDADVRAIRSAYEVGNMTQRELAQKYKVSKFAIYAIVNRRTWKHI